MANYNQALNRLLKIEGYYSDHESDPGGETAWGIAKAYWPEYWEDGVPDRDTAKRFYRQEFWSPLRLDEVHDQDVAFEVFDIAVNMGKRRAVSFAQLNHNMVTRGNPIAVDGIIGPQTLQALNTMAWADTIRWVKSMNGIQYCYYLYRTGQLDSALALFDTTPDPDSQAFFRGWLKRIEFSGNDDG